ncbi:hypothetical protein J7L05_03760 [bacterium]|nr:hypothetical protein [bacterium]
MRRPLILLILGLVILLAGCSSSTNPIAPPESTGASNRTDVDYSLSQALFPHDSSGITGNAIISAFEGVINTDTLEYHFTPLRQAGTIGDSFQVDITYFLDGIPCGNCLRIGDIRIDEDANLEVEFEAMHPFDNAGDRLDLPVFDVRGILVNKTPDLTVFYNILADMDSDGTVDTPAAADINFLLNADGYTTFFDLVTESFLGLDIPGNLNPYKLFFVDPTQGNFNPAHPNGVNNVNQPRGHNVFAQGTKFTDPGASQLYVINGGLDTTISFIFILDCSYGHAATFRNTYDNPGEPGSRDSPKFFVPEFNRKEVWKLEVELLDNNLAPYDSASTAQFQITACDWQAGVTPSGDFSEDAAFDDIRHASDVGSLVFDIPGILADAIDQNLSHSTGAGSDSDPYTWIIDFTNELSANPGDYYGLVCVRDEICALLDGTTPPFGVDQDSQTSDIRDFATYQTFEIEIPGLEGVFQADPHRTNLDLVTDITQPTSDSVELDLAVVENDNINIAGVYMPDAYNQITRYKFDYSDAVFHAPGRLPIDNTGDHPHPDTAMAIRRLDASEKGVTGVGYLDANETFWPFHPDLPVLPAGNIFFLSYCVIPPPEPPYDTIYPLDLFAMYLMTDSDDDQRPAVSEYEEEDPLPIDIWEDFDNNIGCVWETTKYTNMGNGLYDTLYFGTDFDYPIDPADPPTADPLFSVSLSGIPSNDIKGVDRTDTGYVYYAFSGADTLAAWGYDSLLVGLDGADPDGNPTIGGIPIYSGSVIDMEILPYDDTYTRIINGIEQTAPIAVCLTDNKTIEFIDTVTGQIIQTLDGASDGSISGDPKHLDIGNTSFTVHVTHLDGTTPRVTVFILF